MFKFLKRAGIGLAVAIALMVGITTPSQAVIRSDVAWFQISVNGDVVYGKAYYQVDTSTNRRYVTDVGYRTNSADGATLVLCDPYNTCWNFIMNSPTTYYLYSEVRPDPLSTKNAWVTFHASSSLVWRTATVQLPWIPEG